MQRAAVILVCLAAFCAPIFGQNEQVKPPQPGANNPAAGAVPSDGNLLSFDACKEDVHRLCNKEGIDLKSDLAILECLQDAGQTESATLTRQCEDLVWQYKVKLTQDERFTQAAVKYCQEEIDKSPAMKKCTELTQPGYALSCLLEFTPNVTATSQCHAFLRRTAVLAFGDFRLIGPFVEKCGATLGKLGCGTLTPHKAHEGVRVPHTQGMALECLISNVVKHGKDQSDPLQMLDAGCRHEVMRLVEMQTDDFHLDRTLFFACRQDRERYCKEVQAGQGKVFECLMMNRNDQFMEPECAKMLGERAYLMGRNYRMAHPLVKACANEMKEYKCEPQDELESAAHFHLTWILLCLESHAHNAQSPEKMPSPQCQHEMLTHRQMMITEFHMAPDVVMHCSQEIDKWCSPRGDIEPKGLTLHCLMEHASSTDKTKQVGAQCMQALKDVVKVADVGSNYKVDKVLYGSCRSLIDGACARETGSESETLTCLMRHVDSSDMTPMCEQRLLEVQYFMARDWTLDPQLYEACHDEAVSRCHAPANWHMSSNGPDPGPAVLACLYRSAYDDEVPLSKKGEIIRCLSEVRFEHKVLGTDADLTEPCKHQLKVAYLQQEQVEFDDKEHMADADPKFAEKCAREIRQFKCDQADSFEDTVECLRLNYENLGPECKSMVFYREKIEAADNTMDDELQRKCKYDIGKFCPGQNGEHVLDCLTNTKIVRLLQKECKAVVQERMRESARDIRLRPGLLLACKTEAETYCMDELKKLKMPQYAQKVLEGAVVGCLREKYRESAHNRIDLSAQCQAEITKAIVEAEFDPQLDPPLYHACQDTIRLHCSAAIIQHSGGFDTVLDCLKADFHKGAISDPDCNKQIARRVEETMIDIHLDPPLLEACSIDMQRLCRDVVPGHSRIIMCLMEAAESTNAQMSSSCRNMLADRNKLWMKAHQQYQMAWPESWHEAYSMVATHPHKISILGWLSGIVFFILLVGCCCGRLSKRTHMELKNR
nr:Cysteine rich repeat domain containing protein [Haemonchus contortus]